MAELNTSGVPGVHRRAANLAQLLTHSARRFPDHVGIVSRARTWTWREIDARVDALAAALAALGVVKGDRVLVQSKNCVQMVETMFACFRLGAVWVPANFRQTPEEVAHLAVASGARAMFCHADFPAHAQAARKAAPALATFIAIGAAAFGPDHDALVAAHLGQSLASVETLHDDPCWFFFTSGTTGRPKAAVLTHGQMGFVVTNHLCDLMPGTSEADASLVVAPLSHGAGIHLLTQVARGAKSVLMEGDRFDVGAAWSLVARWRVSNMFTVPTILKLLAEHPSVDATDHSSLRHVIYAGAPMHRRDQLHALRKLGKVLVQYYGLGEVTGNITVLPPHLHDDGDGEGALPGTCGHARTGMQISVQDGQGREVAAGGSGEVCVCGPAVFAGYHDNPGANAAAFRDGWFRTGDLGHVDAQGFLYLTGRASDMYISGGSNIYPIEIEEKLLTHPAIAEVKVIGVPDDVWGEVGVAACVLAPGAALSEAELLAAMAGKIAKYKLPRRVVFLDALPRSAYGKITKALVREALAARGALGA